MWANLLTKMLATPEMFSSCMPWPSAFPLPPGKCHYRAPCFVCFYYKSHTGVSGSFLSASWTSIMWWRRWRMPLLCDWGHLSLTNLAVHLGMPWIGILVTRALRPLLPPRILSAFSWNFLTSPKELPSHSCVWNPFLDSYHRVGCSISVSSWACMLQVSQPLRRRCLLSSTVSLCPPGFYDIETSP